MTDLIDAHVPSLVFELSYKLQRGGNTVDMLILKATCHSSRSLKLISYNPN